MELAIIYALLQCVCLQMKFDKRWDISMLLFIVCSGFICLMRNYNP